MEINQEKFEKIESKPNKFRNDYKGDEMSRIPPRMGLYGGVGYTPGFTSSYIVNRMIEAQERQMNSQGK